MNTRGMPSLSPEARRGRFRIFVLTLVGAALASATFVTGQSLYRASHRKQILDLRYPCIFAGEGVLKSDGGSCRVLVIESVVNQWPGPNPEDLVVTDMNYHVLKVLHNRPESIFVDHSFDAQSVPQTLTMRRAVRPGFQTEIIRYATDGSTLHEISRVFDPPEIDIGPTFSLREARKRSTIADQRGSVIEDGEPGVGADSR